MPKCGRSPCRRKNDNRSSPHNPQSSHTSPHGATGPLSAPRWASPRPRGRRRDRTRRKHRGPAGPPRLSPLNNPGGIQWERSTLGTPHWTIVPMAYPRGLPPAPGPLTRPEADTGEPSNSLRSNVPQNWTGAIEFSNRHAPMSRQRPQKVRCPRPGRRVAASLDRWR
jgi:hypothetical protein